VNPVPMTSARRGPAASMSRSLLPSSRVRNDRTPSRAASASFGQGRARTPVAMSRRSKGHLLAVAAAGAEEGRRTGGREVEIGVSRPGPASTPRST
jgi:hypothetical protein